MSILKTEKPKTIENILNGKQTILVMKQTPKNAEGRWWYLYCSEKGGNLFFDVWNEKAGAGSLYFITNNHEETLWLKRLNGKVVARFWCNKIEEIKYSRKTYSYFIDGKEKLNVGEIQIGIMSHLNHKELNDRLKEDSGYAIHISKLEIFDKPRELGEFRKTGKHCKYQGRDMYCDYCSHCDCIGDELTKAPTNYCWVDDFFFDNEETKEPESVLIDEKETDGFCR